MTDLDRVKAWLSDGPFWAFEPTEDEAAEVARSLAALLGELREECAGICDRRDEECAASSEACANRGDSTGVLIWTARETEACNLARLIREG